jgi:HK97 family phage portal protein
MTSALRIRAELMLEQDRAVRRSMPAVVNETLSISSGVRGSQLYGWLTEGLAGSVSEAQAMRVGAVYACVGLIGGAIAAMPFHLYARGENGRTRLDDDLWWLFNESPHPGWPAASAWQHAAQSVLLKGDAFWEILRASRYSPRIVGFEPHHPDVVRVSRVEGRNRYTLNPGTPKQRELDQDDVLHFPGIGFNGLRSMTPISAALGSTADLALAADGHTSAFFRGGARPDHAIVVPPTLKVDDKQRDLIRDTWSRQRDHYTSTGMPPVLVGGMEIKPLTVNAEDAQLLETRQQSVEDIARIMGVPPHMIGKTDASTSWGSGIEQMSIGFVRYTVARHLNVISQEINRKVWPRSRIRYGEFNLDALLEGDSKTQAEYLAKALGGPGSQGWMTVNQVRQMKNMPPINEPWANTVQRAGAASAATSEDTTNA